MRELSKIRRLITLGNPPFLERSTAQFQRATGLPGFESWPKFQNLVTSTSLSPTCTQKKIQIIVTDMPPKRKLRFFEELIPKDARKQRIENIPLNFYNCRRVVIVQQVLDLYNRLKSNHLPHPFHSNQGIFVL